MRKQTTARPTGETSANDFEKRLLAELNKIPDWQTKLSNALEERQREREQLERQKREERELRKRKLKRQFLENELERIKRKLETL